MNIQQHIRNISGRSVRDPFLIALSIFIFIQIVLYFTLGIGTGLEAEKYINEGNSLFETGTFSAPKYLFYLPVILLVWLCRVLHISIGMVVLFQMAISAIALRSFYLLVMHLSKPVTAGIAATLLALFIPLQSWNLFLYSDSIFISLCMIYSWVIYRQSQNGSKGTLIILSFLVLLIFSRPHGLLFIPPTIIYLVLRKQSNQQRTTAILFSLGLLTAMYFTLNAIFTGGGDMDAMKPFIEEHVICFVPLKPQGADLNIIHTSSPVNDLFYYIMHNPAHFIRLSLLKLLSFFNLTRSYYSSVHNIALVLFFVPVYLLSFRGIRHLYTAGRDFSIYLTALLILYPFGATFQCDDWHSRFTMIVFPYFIMFASFGAMGLFQKRAVTNGKTASSV